MELHHQRMALHHQQMEQMTPGAKSEATTLVCCKVPVSLSLGFDSRPSTKGRRDLSMSHRDGVNCLEVAIIS
jgi:hypothetical protein